MERQVDAVADRESMDIGQLLFGRLTGCRYPLIETTPVVDGFRVGHSRLIGAEKPSSNLPLAGRAGWLQTYVVGPDQGRSVSQGPRDEVLIRTPDRRLRVFVSSTLGELAEERRAVSRAVRRCGCPR